jgi:hypothetical protein
MGFPEASGAGQGKSLGWQGKQRGGLRTI